MSPTSRRVLLNALALAAVLVAGAPEAWSAAAATLKVTATGARFEVFLNGQMLGTEREAELQLSEGLNTVALVAESTGPDSMVAPVLTIDDQTLPADERWLALEHEPPEGWMTSGSAKGWGHAKRVGEGLWAEAQAAKVYLRRGVYVSPEGPRFAPKMARVYMPRGSAQLLKPYLPKPEGLDVRGYRLVTVVPTELEFVAADGTAGSKPAEVTPRGEVGVGGRKYRRYEARYALYPGTGLELNMRWGDDAGATLAYQPAIQAGGTFDWTHFRRTVTAPTGARSVKPLIIKWQQRGITGTFWVDNVVVREEGSEKNLLAVGTFDEPVWKPGGRIVAGEGVSGSQCCKIVSTEKTADRQQALWVGKDAVPVVAGRKYIIEMDAKAENVGSPDQRPRMAALFRTAEDAAEGVQPIFTYFEAEGGSVTEVWRSAELQILPPLKGIRPRRARICPCYYSSMFEAPEVQAAYADNCWNSGITWTYGRTANRVAAKLLPKGLRVILSIPYEPWHAPPTRRNFLEEHPELCAQGFKGQPLKHVICPTWLQTQGQDILAGLEEYLLGLLNGSQYFGANWDVEQPVVDPPTFCVCPRCLAAFRRQAKLATEVELNGKVILEKYSEAFTDFRCRQNAWLAGEMARIIKKADRPIEFSMYSGYQSDRTRRHYGVDWALLRPHLQLGIAGYGGNREAIRATRRALGEVPFMGGEMFYLSPNSDSRATPRVEQWRNRVLRQFVESGGVGCLIWYLPVMEGGAFYATSEAAAIIAQYEEIFTANQRCEDKVRVSELKPEEWQALEAEGRRLILLYNFADEERQVTVENDGLPEEVTYREYGSDEARQVRPAKMELVIPPNGTKVLLLLAGK